MMKNIIFIVTLVVSLAAAAEKSPPRSESKKRILNGCMKLVKQSATVKKAICECIVTKLDEKLNNEAMGMMALEYEEPGGREGGAESSLMTFDRHVAEDCFAKATGASRDTDSVRTPAAATPTVNVDPKGKFLVINNGNMTGQVPLNLSKNMALEAKPSYYGDTNFGVIVAPIESEDAASTFIYAVDGNGKKLWFMDMGAFNASAPLIEKDFVYLSTIGKVFKIEKQTGKVVWTHEGLYENKKFQFNGAEPILRSGENIVFSKKVQVKDQTGKLVEGAL